MDRSAINRKDLKRNILKEIIMRLDFQGVLQAEMERILLEAKPYLKSKGFNRYTEKVNGQIFEEESSLKDVKSYIVYSFIAEDFGYSLDLSASSIILSVKTQGYAPFEAYSEIFRWICALYTKKIDFFTCKRFGLRKINFCFLKSLQAITKYFALEYFNSNTPICGPEIQSIERRDHLVDGLRSLNLRYAIEQGQLAADSIYKVTIDTDIYLTDQKEIETLVSNESNLLEINEKVFQIFLGSINDDLIRILSCDNTDNDEVLGVECNE